MYVTYTADGLARQCIFIYPGTVTSEDVKMALYVEEEDDVEVNMVLFNFLLEYIDTLNEKGTNSYLL